MAPSHSHASPSFRSLQAYIEVRSNRGKVEERKAHVSHRKDEREEANVHAGEEEDVKEIVFTPQGAPRSHCGKANERNKVRQGVRIFRGRAGQHN